MFKKVLLSVMTLGLLSTSPVLALDPPPGHGQLIDTLRAHGVYVEINPNEVCDATKTEKSMHGVYTYSERHSTPLMGICQDYGGNGEQTIWTENDLDTLRHETIHYIQDCINGSVDGELAPLYDGPGGYSNIEYGIKDIIGVIGPEQAQAIITRYEAAGASPEIIQLELEAFYLAKSQTAETIATVVDAKCPVQ